MAFVGFVGLYACNVRRIESEKRKPANFLALAVAFCVCRLGCCGCFAPVVCVLRLCWLCFLCWVVLLVAFFPFGRYDKKKGHTVLALPLFVRGLWACYSLANCSRASCHTFAASSGFSPQLFQCWRLTP